MLEILPCLWNFRIHLGKKCIFQPFLSLTRPRPYKVGLPNCRCVIKSWQISCRYVYIFRKSNSIIPIHHNLSFCTAKSSIPFVKCVFVKINFTKGLYKNCWKMHFFPKWILKFHEQGKISNTDQYLSWKLVS